MARKIQKEKNNFDKIKREMVEKRQKAEPSKIEIKDQVLEVNEIEENLNKLEVSIRNKKEIEEDHFENILTFYIQEEVFGLRVSSVKEIIRIPKVTNVAHMPMHIMGICTLREELLPIINTHHLFGLSSVDSNENSRIIVMDRNGEKIGLYVDRVAEVINIRPEQIKEAPSSLNGVEGGYVEGIIALQGGSKLIIMLNEKSVTELGQMKLDYSHDEQNMKLNQADEVQKEQLILFQVGDEEYAISIDYVKEIIRLPSFTKIPNSPSYIEGMFAVRNELLLGLHLRKLFHYSDENMDESSRVIIINVDNITLGVIVDRVSHITSIEKSSRNDRHTEHGVSNNFISRIVNSNQKMYMILDCERLIPFVKSSIIDQEVREVEAKMMEEMLQQTNDIQMVIFKLDTEEYGVEIHTVSEITNMIHIRKYPGTPYVIEGIINLRDDVIPIINLKRLFGIETSYHNESTKTIIAELEGKKVGILVDSVSEILKCSSTQLEQYNGLLITEGNVSYINQIAKVNQKRSIMMLNLMAIIHNI